MPMERHVRLRRLIGYAAPPACCHDEEERGLAVAYGKKRITGRTFQARVSI
jgi:hypothetical protein